jgi:hypothetical protein
MKTMEVKCNLKRPNEDTGGEKEERKRIRRIDSTPGASQAEEVAAVATKRSLKRQNDDTGGDKEQRGLAGSIVHPEQQRQQKKQRQ